MWSFLSGLASILWDFHSHSRPRSQGLKPSDSPIRGVLPTYFPHSFHHIFSCTAAIPHYFHATFQNISPSTGTFP
ncbi:hypothetical protein Agau_C201878 [Agrobacterium tumefaciens F2]|nr:hypothetical protein Agau_C201878 [Agrobacterium tumefaciens F2]